jgi:hypothetical protein
MIIDFTSQHMLGSPVQEVFDAVSRPLLTAAPPSTQLWTGEG